MKCIIKRNIFNLFEFFSCTGCKNKKEDEYIYIGRNVIAIYHLFDNCINLEIDVDFLVYDNPKLKLLLRDAIKYQDEIFFCFLEDFKLDNYYEMFEKIIEDNFSIQIITM
ncbi:MAG: hypothetical protein WC006_03565 [Bacilli bacterium]|nr:hypothetical protein [Bacilli bacterium]